MNNLLKIAVGSLWQHRVKTFVAGAVLFIGSFLLFSGRTVSTAVSGAMSKVLTRTLTGDIVIASLKNENTPNLLDTRGLETITNSETIMKKISSVANVDATAMMAKGVAQLHIGDANPDTPSLVLGVDQKRYKKAFSLFRRVAGADIDSAGRGIWINEDYYSRVLQRRIKIGESLTCIVMNRNGFLNTVKLVFRGLFRLEGMGGFSSFINVIDIASYRTLYGMQGNGNILSRQHKKVIKKNAALLDGTVDIEKMLDGNVLSSKGIKTDNIRYAYSNPVKNKQQLLTEKKSMKNLSEFITVTLHNPALVDKTIKDLNQLFKKQKLGVRAYHWQDVSGALGQFLVLINIVLIALVVIIFSMLIIIIMNSMLMTALERIYEIGTMRAIGASRLFIVKMFLAESFFLGLLFGGAGALLGGIFCEAIGSIPASNQMTMMLFGGPSLAISADLGIVISTMAIITLFAILSSVYPSWVASKFSPIEAIRDK